jgi:hypothetical protein
MGPCPIGRSVGTYFPAERVRDLCIYMAHFQLVVCCVLCTRTYVGEYIFHRDTGHADAMHMHVLLEFSP